ncbi:hypothetical protein C8J55DRAFT_490299 [Lentinula edodes]|uniref:Uncharacterized protein n=1 Tax=Lentinula lateritia TaxID=40482 RepID=A0A9W9DL77_9AGAR|nr:hypothetical protein C8J55DRAFT_490299 [Lentinula edodes]
MSERYVTHATPTLFNAGTPLPQMSSCFPVCMKDDSLQGMSIHNIRAWRLTMVVTGDVSDQKLGLVIAWTNVWRVYEDNWRSWGSIRQEGDDDLTLSTIATRKLKFGVRAQGLKVDCQPVYQQGDAENQWVVPWVRSGSCSDFGNGGQGTNIPQSSSTDAEVGQADAELLSSMESEREEMQLRTTLAVLQTFHVHTSFQLSILESLLPPRSERSNNTINLVPKDILAFELGPFSSVVGYGDTSNRIISWWDVTYLNGV